MLLRVKNILWAALLLFSVGPAAFAFEPFTITDIEINGLQRISVGTLLNYLSVSVGDTLTEERSAEVIRTLFKTGFFNNIRVAKRDGVLLIEVEESPAIASIAISGNKDIETDQLREALKSIGLAEGRVFDRSSLDKVEKELERQYFSQGKYGIKVVSTVSELENNRVDIKIDINEGSVAKIRHINIVGNSAYSDEELLGKFQLQIPGMLSLFSSSDQYSRNRLSADLEVLRSFYLDNGYVNFSIDSTQVSISPDKQDVFVTINVTEGDRYMVEDVKLSGDLVVSEAELFDLVTIRAGEVFSRRKATESSTAISERLGKEGFAFANVNTAPKIDRKNKTVSLTFFVDPGKRIYVRRINVAGNLKTRDEVLRREVRQMEGGWIATDKINRSRVRLQRLGFFDEVNVETPMVPGVDDQVDVNFSVKERPSGTLMAGMGYSQTQGFLVNASVSQNNLLGTGKRVSATVNNSSVNKIYSFAYHNPYYTLDGISRGFTVFNRSTDAGAANVGDFTSDIYGADVNFGYPLSEYDTGSLSFGYENTKLKTTAGTPQSFLDFINKNTDQFDIYKLTASFSHDTRDRTIFAESGVNHRISTEIALPGSGLEFYKLVYRGQKFMPVVGKLTFMAKGEIGYGDSYGDTTELPFFENFYAGGTQSVRGFRGNSLGPRDNGNPQGGGFETVGNLELIFPPPFSQDNKSLRMSTFFDIGNVFAKASDFDAQELRYSIGISAIWFTPVAPMTFSLAWPLNDKLGDETERFQFTLGSFFF